MIPIAALDLALPETVGTVLLLGAGALAVVLLVVLLLAALRLRTADRDERDDDESAETLPQSGPGRRHAAGPAPLSNSTVVSGCVVGPDRHPLAGALVSITDLHGRQFDQALSGQDGGYRLAVPSGGTYLLVCSDEGRRPATSLVTVGVGGPRRDILLAGGCLLHGRVYRPSGRPVADATVTLTDARGEVVETAATDSAGEFELVDLHAGDYTLTVTGRGALPNAQTFSIDGVRPLRCDVMLMSNAAIAGAVRSATSGTPVREASVALVDAFGNVAARTVTGEDGRYHFRDVAPGTYTLTASGYAPSAASVELMGDRTERRDVVLGTRDVITAVTGEG